MAKRFCAKREAFGYEIGMMVVLLLVVLMAFCNVIAVSARSDQDIRERFYGNLSINSSAQNSGNSSIAQMFDRVLQKEFSENDQPQGGSDGSSFNNSVADQQAVLETVAKVTHEKGKKNETQEANGTRSFQFQDVFSLENEGSDDMTTLIDKKMLCFIMLHFCRLISDLVVVIVSAAIAGIIFSCLGQPVIVGYLLAGSLIGPGGLNFISEMVQGPRSIPSSGPGGFSTAIGISSNSDDDDNLPIATRVTKFKTCRTVLPDVEEEPIVGGDLIAEAEAKPVVEAANNVQVPPAVEVAAGDIAAEGLEPLHPSNSMHSGRSTVGGDDFVPETPREDRGMREPLEVVPPTLRAASGECK
ncbi:unnamed protein product [Camellia sinensis]